MDTNYFQNIINEFSSIALLIFILFFFIKKIFPSYLSEKAKNIATKEDIGKITSEVEKIKLQNQLVLENTREKHQLRMAALDRRLQAHQEAFALWRKLLSNIHSENIIHVVMECQDWWGNNCLYLSSEARKEFLNAYTAAGIHKSYVDDINSKNLARENWKEIKDAGAIIVKGVELPSLEEKESNILS